MARLDSPPIPAVKQFRAVAYLRWLLFKNGFRRKGGKGELVARFITFPFAAIILLSVISSAFASAYGSVRHGDLGYLTGIFSGIFLLQVVVSVNIAPPGLSFDPESLIRFPLNFSRYLLIRLFLGLLSASTIIGTVSLLAAATGITVARPDLAPVACAAALALAIANMLFTRMVFAWVDRWLSTRRAREFFTFFIIAISLGFQYVNVTINGLGKHTSHAQQTAKLNAMLNVYHHAEPVLQFLPPGLAGQAITHAAHKEAFPTLFSITGILGYSAFFLVVFAWRMQREYRGENLSEVTHAKAPQPTKTPAPIRPEADLISTQLAPPAKSVISPALSALLLKEWIYIRRNPAQFYGLIAPLAMVFILAGRMGRFAATGLVFPAAAAYSILGVSTLAYNVLGLDASGVQFYFLSPVPMRTIFLAKNLFGFAITATQLVLLYILLAYTSGPPPLLIAVMTLCWVFFAALVNVTVGNIRSITTPKRIDPSKISRKQASQLSALLSLALMLVVAAVGAGLILLSRAYELPWLPVPVLLALAIGAFALYWSGLGHIDALAQNHRETLVEELSKTA